jgi:hypothetical protein
LIKNHTNNNDFSALMDDFDTFVAEVTKVTDVVQGDKGQAMIIRNVVRFEDCVTTIAPEQKKKLNKNNSQAYNKLK